MPHSHAKSGEARLPQAKDTVRDHVIVCSTRAMFGRVPSSPAVQRNSTERNRRDNKVTSDGISRREFSPPYKGAQREEGAEQM
jgi:hypothetical protein